MLSEGNWWYAESKDTFDSLAATYPNADKDSRHFAVMPYPKATEEKVGEKQTVMNMGYSLAFLKKGISPEKQELLKLFYKWCHTDRALQAYTMASDHMRDFEYEMTEEQLASMNMWSRTSYEYIKNADIVYAYSRARIYASYPSDFYVEDMFRTKVAGETHLYPSSAMKDYGVNATDYFFGMKNYYSQSFWSRYL